MQPQQHLLIVHNQTPSQNRKWEMPFLQCIFLSPPSLIFFKALCDKIVLTDKEDVEYEELDLANAIPYIVIQDIFLWG